MAITFGALLASGNNAITSFTTGSITPTAGNLNILTFMARNNTNASPGVAGNGVTWTRLAISGSGNEMQVWYSVGGTPGTIAVTSLTSSTENIWMVSDFSGTLTSGTIFPQSSYSTGSGTAISTTLASGITSGNTAFGFAHRGNAAVTFTAGSGFTKIGQRAGTGRAVAAEYELNKSDDSVVDMTIDNTGSWNVCAFEIAADGGGGGPTYDGKFFQLF